DSHLEDSQHSSQSYNWRPCGQAASPTSSNLQRRSNLTSKGECHDPRRKIIKTKSFRKAGVGCSGRLRFDRNEQRHGCVRPAGNCRRRHFSRCGNTHYERIPRYSLCASSSRRTSLETATAARASLWLPGCKSVSEPLSAERVPIWSSQHNRGLPFSKCVYSR